MTLFEQLKATYLEKRKARDTQAVSSLSTLIGEIETLAKAGKGETTDLVVVTMVKKFIKNLDETIEVAKKNGDSTKVDALWNERELYSQFLPKQLTEPALMFLIDELVAGGATSVGDVMKALKTNYGGTYDGAIASKILKAKFA